MKSKKVVNINHMNQDYEKSTQPEQSSPFILNGLVENNEGDTGLITSEKSNRQLTTLPTGYNVIGTLPIDKQEHILFLAKENQSNSAIVKIDEFGNITTILEDSCLNFSVDYPIDSEYKIREGCNRNIYFVDGLNPDRTVDIDNTADYLDPSGNLICDKIVLDRPFLHPCVTLDKVLDGGGNTEPGVYQFGIQYLDEDLNGTQFMSITPTIPITVGSSSGNYEDIQGGDSTYANTTKSIKLTINNLDTNFAYYRIVVIATNSGSTQVYYKPFKEIQSSSTSYLFTGINASTDTLGVLEDVSRNKLPYDSSKHIEQIDSRLIRMNIKEKQVDYSVFQREAMNITSEYVTKIVEAERSDNELWSPKSARNYVDLRGYLRDEVYAFGIVWIFNDGTKTPPFHIPGREKITDAGLVTIGNSNTHNRPLGFNPFWDDEVLSPNEDTEHLSGTLERWKVYNTAIRTSTNNSGSSIANGDYYTRGKLAYYESELNYPTITDCSGNTIYGSAAGTPIRFHKMPDTTLEPHYIAGDLDGTSFEFNNLLPGTNKIVPLGIEFSNITPPAQYASQIAGYKIVRVHRDESNTSVFDKGILFENRLLVSDGDTIGYRQSYPYYNEASPLDYNIPKTLASADDGRFCDAPAFIESDRTKNCFSVHTPRLKFTDVSALNDHIKIEREVGGDVIYYTIDNTGNNYNYTSRVNYYDSHIPNTFRTNRKINSSVFVNALSEVQSGLNNRFFNQNQQETYVLETEDTLDEPANISDSVYLTSSQSTPYHNPTNPHSHAYYVALKNFNSQMYSNLENLIYYETNNCPTSVSNTSTVVFGGDCIIASFSVRKTWEGTDRSECGNTSFAGDWDETSLFTFYCESVINSELRHEGLLAVDSNSCNEGYYPKTYSVNKSNIEDYLNLPSSCVNYYLYNTDYSKENEIKSYFPISTSYNYCSNCLNQYKTRILASQKAYQEERSDNYRVFLVNNYIDIPSHTGEITDGFVEANKLFIKTEQSLWKQEVRPQQLNSDVGPIFVGTGEIFSIEPEELKPTTHGYMGGFAKWGNISTPYGFISISENEGRIFKFNQGGVDEISMRGLSNYFQNNLNLSYFKQIKRLSKGYISKVKDNAFKRNSVGFTSCFDKPNKRVIITKKDYVFRSDKEELIKGIYKSPTEYYDFDLNTVPIGSTTPILWKDDENVYVQIIDTSGYSTLDLEDTSYFENKSFTLSYSFLLDKWISFHSYIPNVYYNDQDNFYSIRNLSRTKNSPIYVHDDKTALNYYEVDYPFIIECVLSKDPVTKTGYPTLEFITRSQSYDSSRNQWYENENDTFTRCIMYNDYQSSGEQNIVLKDTTPFLSISSTDTLIDKSNRSWFINDYRDYSDHSINEPLFTSQWVDILSSSFNYYIDKVSNNTKVNKANTSIYNYKRLKDKFICARMIYDNNNKFTVKFVIPQFNNVIK